MARPCYLVKVAIKDTSRRTRRSDGARTHAAILDAAVRLASVEGLSALTLGRLAEEVGVSKSGLYAHFGAKQQLQLDVIQAAREIFDHEVIEPALEMPPGREQLVRVCAAYLSYIERRVFPGGCFFAGMLAEFDARSGIAHDEIRADHREWTELLEDMATQAQQRGELSATADVRQLAFELTAAIQFANFHHVLLNDPEVIERARTAIQAALARATP